MGQSLTHPALEAYRIPRMALPNHFDSPAEIHQILSVPSVPRLVPGELHGPILRL